VKTFKQEWCVKQGDAFQVDFGHRDVVGPLSVYKNQHKNNMLVVVGSC